MLRGLYAAGAGLNLQQVTLDVVANNIANATTDGFKNDRVGAASFPELLVWRLEPPKPQPVGTTAFGTVVAVIETDYRQGLLENTGELRDVALLGPGFFVVETGTGERYFRGGTLFVDREGYLVTAAGERLLGEGGPVQVGTSNFSVGRDGTVYVDGQPVDRLLVVEFPDRRALVKEGNGYFRADGAPWEAATETEVLQGYREASNVDLTAEMTRLLEGLRAYQLNQRVLRTQDELLGKAVNQVGKVR